MTSSRGRSRLSGEPPIRAGSTWNAKADFHGPAVTRLGPWEQLAQVLLSANEFVFVD